jgi:predicted metal-binding membrane protein
LSGTSGNARPRFARLRLPSALAQAPRGLLLSLAALTGAAWALTLVQALSMSAPMGVALRGGLGGEGMAGMAMGGMSAAGWSLSDAAFFLAAWTIMMTAMMLPAAAPMILVFASAQARRRPDIAVPTWIFVAGYLLVWAATGLAVYALVQLGSDVATSLAAPARAVWAPLALGATLVAAGLYQFTPLKRACLGHCRSPFAFVARHWRDGRAGAFAMGLRHGSYCLGCCWALFAVLVAAGVMSLAWMLLLTLLVVAEKTLPQGRRYSAAIGVSLVALGALVACGSLPMPWLA